VDGRRSVGALLLAVGLGLGGCDQLASTSDAVLPVQLSLLVELDDGSPLSVVVDLRRNTRHQLDVRVSRGMRFFDGVHLMEATPIVADGATTLRFNELLSHRWRDLPMRMGRQPEILAMRMGEVSIKVADRVFTCDTDRWSCLPAVAPNELPYEHPGPGRGFHLWVEDGTALLTLPMDETDAGEPILRGIKRVIGLHWVRERIFEGDKILDRLYRGRSDVRVDVGSVTVDGELDEWASAVPTVVDSPWQLDDGAASWAGPRDASFSVAAMRSGTELCFAGRVRDQAIGPGDRLELVAGALHVDLDLTQTPRDWFGGRFELCQAHPGGTGVLPFAATLTDVDPQEEPTVIASAPIELGRPTGVLRE